MRGLSIAKPKGIKCLNTEEDESLSGDVAIERGVSPVTSVDASESVAIRKKRIFARRFQLWTVTLGFYNTMLTCISKYKADHKSCESSLR